MRPTWGQLMIGALVIAGSAASLKVPAILLGGTDETTPHLVAPQQQGHPTIQLPVATAGLATPPLPPFLGPSPVEQLASSGNGNAVEIADAIAGSGENGTTSMPPLQPPQVDPDTDASPSPKPNPTPDPTPAPTPQPDPSPAPQP